MPAGQDGDGPAARDTQAPLARDGQAPAIRASDRERDARPCGCRRRSPKAAWTTPSSTPGCAAPCPPGPGPTWTGWSPTSRRPAPWPARPGRGPARAGPREAGGRVQELGPPGRPVAGPDRYTTVVYKGGGWLDLRAAELTAPVTTLLAVAYKSRITILVPPGIRVEAGGFGAPTPTRGPSWPRAHRCCTCAASPTRARSRSAAGPPKTEQPLTGPASSPRAAGPPCSRTTGPLRPRAPRPRAP